MDKKTIWLDYSNKETWEKYLIMFSDEYKDVKDKLEFYKSDNRYAKFLNQQKGG